MSFQPTNKLGQVLSSLLMLCLGYALLPAGHIHAQTPSQQPLGFSIAIKKQAVCSSDRFLKVETVLTNLGDGPVVVDVEGIAYSHNIEKKKKVPLDEYPYEVRSILKDPDPDSVGTYIVLAKGESVRKTLTISLQDDFFKDGIAYTLNLRYGQFHDRVVYGQKIFRGSVVSNKVAFKINDCDWNQVSLTSSIKRKNRSKASKPPTVQCRIDKSHQQ
jgi:hypothetical protein